LDGPGRLWTAAPKDGLGVRRLLAICVVALELLLVLPQTITASMHEPKLDDRKLHALVLAEAPGFRQALARGQKFKAAEILLHWVSPRIPGAAPTQQAPESTTGLGEDYYSYFAPASLGSMCGGAADFFRRLLNSFGIPAVTVDFGKRSLFTHVTTLVPMHGSRDWAVLDPTFDMEIVSRRGGRPVPFARAVSIAAHGRAHTQLHARTRSLARRTLIATDGRRVACTHSRAAGMCDFRNLDAALPALTGAGYRGLSAYLALFGNGRIFSVTNGNAEVLRAHARYRALRSAARHAESARA
jgi:hypothetical protein